MDEKRKLSAETQSLLAQINAFLPTMMDRRRPETHQDALKAIFGGPDVSPHACQRPNAAPAR
jgi:hypothetical protein